MHLKNLHGLAAAFQKRHTAATEVLLLRAEHPGQASGTPTPVVLMLHTQYIAPVLSQLPPYLVRHCALPEHAWFGC